MAYYDSITLGRNLTSEERTYNAWQFYEYFTHLGFTIDSICGMLGNIQWESGIDPAKKNVNTAWGLIQWHPTSSLTAWANANHCVWYDGDKQALLIYRELFPVPTDPYDTSGRWTYDSTHGYTYTPDEFKVLGDYDIATGSYFYQRERAGDDTLPKRMEYAADWYEVFTGEEPPHPPHPPHPPIGDGSRPFWVYMSKSYKRRKVILL